MKPKSERFPALLLLAAAFVGIVLANSPLSDGFFAVKDFTFGPPVLGLDMSLGSWVSDGLLAIFFFLAGLELLHELESGTLTSWRKALVPLVATLGGVAIPALIYVSIVSAMGEPSALRGWPIPTATDIAFSLGMLGTFGSALPRAARAFLLTLAVVDDLIAIAIIAIFYTSGIQLWAIVAALVSLALFAYIARRTGKWVTPCLIMIAIITWALVHESGVHATVAGVALALVLPKKRVEPAIRALSPSSELAILPIFALFAAGVIIPTISAGALSPIFWAILIALPVGKLLGITGAAFLATTVSTGWRASALRPLDLVAIAMLGGTGFTVSLLTTELSFGRLPELIAEGTVAVLLGSIISMVLGGGFVALRSRHYRNSAPGALRAGDS